MDDVKRWESRWAHVDEPEILLDTRHKTNRDLYPAIYNIISILLALLVSSTTSEKSLSARGLECIYTDMCKSDFDMIIDDFVSRRNQCLDFS